MLGTLRVRAAEALFAPSLVGVAHQAGVDELLASLLATAATAAAAAAGGSAGDASDVRRRLASRVLLTGGALLPGAARRIAATLRASLPTAEPVVVRRIGGGGRSRIAVSDDGRSKRNDDWYSALSDAR